MMGNNNQVGLKKVLGLKECIMIAVGGMIGSAIFGISGITYSLAGPAALLSWFLGGLIILLYALNVAELATTFPEAGGLYVYPSKTLGRTKSQRTFFGWIAAWSWLNVTILGTAFSAIFVSHYLGSLITAVKPYVVPMAVLWIAICWYANIRGASLMGKLSVFLTGFLILICLLFVGVGLGHVNFNNFSNFFSGGVMGSRGIITAIPMAMLGYGSVIAIASIAEEIKNPRRTVPRAIGSAVFITVAVYLLILFVTYGILTWQEVNPQSASYYAPLHAAVMKFASGNYWLTPLISVAALLAITTTMLVLIMDAGRTLLAMGRSKFLPEKFAAINEKYNTPAFGLTVAAAASAVIACFPQFIQQIVGTGSLTSGIMVIIVVFSLIAMRRKPKEIEDRFVVPGGNALPAITIIVVVVTLSQLTKDSFILSGWWYLIGILWFAFRYFTNRDLFTSETISG